MRKLFLCFCVAVTMAGFVRPVLAQGVSVPLGKTTGSWVVGQIELNGQQQPYCSMKNSFSTGYILVFARDAQRFNSIAVEFQGDILSAGRSYAADVYIEPNLHRRLDATAVTSRVLVIQVGKDSVFYEALRRRDRMDFFVPATAKASFSLRGTARAFEDLEGCVSLLPGAQMAAAEEDIYKSVEDTSANIDARKEVSADPNNQLLQELAAARSEISRLKEQQASALSALGGADRTGTVSSPPAPAATVAEQITWETATTPAPPIPAAPVPAAPVSRPPAIAQIETTRPAVVENVATLENPSIRSVSRIEEAIGSTEQQQRRDVESVLLPEQPQQHLPAPTDAPREEYAALPPPADIQQPVATPPPAPSFSTPDTKKSVGQMLPAEISELLRASNVALDSEIQADFPPVSEHAAYSWKTQDLFGGINQTLWMGTQSFAEMVNQYVSVTKSRCPGDFASELEPAQQSGAYTVVIGEIACISDAESAAAALLFYGKPGGQFTVISHEGTTEQMTDAVIIRDQVTETLRARIN